MKKVILVIIMAVIALLGGCASATKGMTPDEKAAYIEQRAYEREVRRLEERDKIRAFILNCKAAKGVVVYTEHGPSSIRRHRRRGEVYIPRYARLIDYQCGSPGDVQDALHRAMGGY